MNTLLYLVMSTLVIGIMFSIMTEQWRHAERILFEREIERMERVRENEARSNRVNRYRESE